MGEKYIKNIDFEKVLDFKNLIEYIENGIESRTFVQREDFSMTLFAFEQGEGVSDYSMPGDTMFYVFEGKMEVNINEDKKFLLQEGESIVVPSDVFHSFNALEKSKVLIIIVKEQK
ncbi:cupin domain-containing protein [Caminicella sporogenes]|uniref:cupin domain-containing protein n=1 Tax=Caminicella sporogenes TaxID=166485 RepID=UPI002540C41E|nr:cupin domain-containing protein [Caminicella sporogenes]WIF95710.1 cupin domain-containing protein [Caminicella sporogenes]